MMQRITQMAFWTALVMVGSIKRLGTAEWYNAFAEIYDAGERRYRPFRREVIRHLRLQPGHTVLDVACGTGQNFDLILEQVGPEGSLIGLDYSPGMLHKAQERMVRHGWSPEQVHLIQADARRLSEELLRHALPDPSRSIDRVVCTLGLAVAPDWTEVFDRMWDILRPGGYCVLMDGYLPPTRSPFQYQVVNGLSRLLTRADVTRRFWEPLQQRCGDYLEQRFPHRLGTHLVIASGQKPGVGQDPMEIGSEIPLNKMNK